MEKEKKEEPTYIVTYDELIKKLKKKRLKLKITALVSFIVLVSIVITFFVLVNQGKIITDIFGR